MQAAESQGGPAVANVAQKQGQEDAGNRRAEAVQPGLEFLLGWLLPIVKVWGSMPLFTTYKIGMVCACLLT